MLSRTRDDVITLLVIHLHDAFDGQIIGFGGPAGKDNLFGIGVNEARDLFACIFDGFLSFPSERMISAGLFAELLDEIRQHGFKDPRVHRSG